MIPGQTAEIAGPKKAFTMNNPKIVASMIKRAKNPLLVIGSKSLETETMDGTLIDTAVKISSYTKMPLAVTGHLISEFSNHDTTNLHSVSIMELGNRLRDQRWEGLNGDGGYDLVLFAGIPYYMEWLVLSGLKNFAPELKTVSLESSYQPNASWSLATMPKEKWKSFLGEVLNLLEEDS
jgi:acetyl-CoA decarbonylase/synthase complex subunit epsilon